MNNEPWLATVQPEKIGAGLQLEIGFIPWSNPVLLLWLQAQAKATWYEARAGCYGEPSLQALTNCMEVVQRLNVDLVGHARDYLELQTRLDSQMEAIRLLLAATTPEHIEFARKIALQALEAA